MFHVGALPWATSTTAALGVLPAVDVSPLHLEARSPERISAPAGASGTAMAAVAVSASSFVAARYVHAGGLLLVLFGAPSPARRRCMLYLRYRCSLSFVHCTRAMALGNPSMEGWAKTRSRRGREQAMNQEQKGAAFRALHEGDPFIIPNPWDVGSGKAMEGLGFKALATTSSGFAFTLGRADGRVTLDEMCAHVRSLAGGTGLPISVDLENGYGASPEAAATAIRGVAEAGAVGGSIEDWDEESGIYPIEQAVETDHCRRGSRSRIGLPIHVDGARRELRA